MAFGKVELQPVGTFLAHLMKRLDSEREAVSILWPTCGILMRVSIDSQLRKQLQGRILTTVSANELACMQGSGFLKD